MLTMRKVERIREQRLEQRQKQTLEQNQEEERVFAYDQFVKDLNSIKHIPTFATPKGYQVTIAGTWLKLFSSLDLTLHQILKMV